MASSPRTPDRTLARLAGLLGGLVWLARWPLAGGDEDGALADAAYWLGLVVLAISLAAYGAGLVKVGWPKVVVGAALPVLAWTVLEALGGGDGLVLDALAGLVVAVVAAVGLVRSRDGAREGTTGGSRRSGTGTHAR